MQGSGGGEYGVGVCLALYDLSSALRVTRYLPIPKGTEVIMVPPRPPSLWTVAEPAAGQVTSAYWEGLIYI